MRFARAGKLTIRTAYYLFAQEKGKEIEDYNRWFKVISNLPIFLFIYYISIISDSSLR